MWKMSLPVRLSCMRSSWFGPSLHQGTWEAVWSFLCQKPAQLDPAEDNILISLACKRRSVDYKLVLWFQFINSYQLMSTVGKKDGCYYNSQDVLQGHPFAQSQEGKHFHGIGHCTSEPWGKGQQTQRNYRVPATQIIATEFAVNVLQSLPRGSAGQ